jgi:phosphatidylserine/phosphatidylglycerophosphate/cardiolipin synthase-like enzyme
MMHSKLAIADDTVVAGSANLDIRSGRINYELVAIVADPSLAAQAERISRTISSSPSAFRSTSGATVPLSRS